MNITGQATFAGGAKYKKSNNDPLFDQVTSIVKFQGFAGNTTVTDSVSGATWTAQDQAVISSAQTKFDNNSSAFTTGTAVDRWTAPYNDSLSLLDNDFCVEMWFYPIAGPTGFTHLLGTWDVANGSLGWHIGYSYSSQAVGVEWTPTGTYDPGRTFLTATSSVPLDQWTHVALVRSATTLTAYINGTASFGSGNTNIATDTIFDPNLGLHAMGQTINNQYFAGYVDSWRVTIGNSRYTANFTPPTESFPLAKYGQ